MEHVETLETGSDGIVGEVGGNGGGGAVDVSGKVDAGELAELERVFVRIKTHFPPAKIKKIMQTDDDIGKVSQATPVIAGRALELFLAMLVKRSYEVAKAADSRRISGDVMKRTLLSDEKFDFLRDFLCDGAAKEEEEEVVGE